MWQRWQGVNLERRRLKKRRVNSGVLQEKQWRCQKYRTPRVSRVVGAQSTAMEAKAAVAGRCSAALAPVSPGLWQKCLESPIHGPGEQCLPVTLVTCENTFLPSQSPPCLSLASSFPCLEPCGPFSPRGTCLLLCLQVAYGTTENSPVTFMGFPNDSIARKTETVGCVFPHTEVTVTLPTCSRSSACSRPQPTLPVWRWSRCMPSCLAQTSPPKLLFFFSTAGKN